MKKSLLALAVLGAIAGVAQAQTAVTIYGSFDGGVMHTRNANAAGDSNTQVGSLGTYNSNRIGFRGVEDLGGGLKARFTLENGFNTGTGALDAPNTLFNRTAAVGIGGNWGWLDIGRQYTNAFLTIAAYDPFSYQYPGIADAVRASAGVRYNNDIKFTGQFGPVTARAEWALGEVAGDNSSGSAKSVSVSYSGGPFAAGAAYSRLEAGALPTSAVVAATPAAVGTETDHWTIGGSAKFGPARVAVGYVDQEATTTAGAVTDTRFAWIGGSYALTPALALTTAFYKTRVEVGAASGDKDNLMLGATYALSKRTNFYTLLSAEKFDPLVRGSAALNATGNERPRRFAVGINHLF